MKYIKICVIGLGYVGFPLAHLFSKKYKTVGYDINRARVEELSEGIDKTNEVDGDLILEAIKGGNLEFTSDLDSIRDCNFYIVSVPTPIDEDNLPDLEPLKKASETVGKVIKPGDIVVFESTVYPGVTEDICVPIISNVSCLEYNTDFFVGYSPERINPGDKKHTVENITKIVSGSTSDAADFIERVYDSVLLGGTYLAPSIKVAEAAKVIENCQRDINIAFMNEISKILRGLGIDTLDVLDAAGSKWNFLPFRPGLVGGHCIGVDPYYLANCAQRSGIYPELILSGRRTNEEVGKYVASETIKLMIKKGIQVKDSKILVLGYTFKEDCPDTRNTKVEDIVTELKEYGISVEIYDPWLCKEIPSSKFDAAIVAVGHKEFKAMNIESFLKDQHVIFDVKGILDRTIVDGRL